MNWRRALAALSLLALASKIMVPTGYMPGTRLAAPIVLCPSGGPVPSVAMDGGGGHADHGKPSKTPHDGRGYQCDFAGLGATGLPAPFDEPAVAPIGMVTTHPLAPASHGAPGRGMAAPPPPSHAPPTFRA